MNDAFSDWGDADISDQNNQHDVHTFAGALYAVRANTQSMRYRVVAAIEDAIGTETGGRTLALARNLTGYVLAADLIGYTSPEFVDWLTDVRQKTLDGRTLISTHEDRPNNWGTHAGAARIAADLFIGDTADLTRAAGVFRGYLGDRSAYAGFKFGDLDWQALPDNPVGVNPLGAIIEGHNVDGVLPDDQRRAGSFTWPPPKENYAWEAMQGVVAQAWLLYNAGYASFGWSDQAVLRACNWLHNVADFPAEGDDRMVPFLVDAAYGTSFASGEAGVGKSLGYTDWTHGGTTASEPPAEEPPAEEPPAEEPPAEEPPAEEPPAEEPPAEEPPAEEPPAEEPPAEEPPAEEPPAEPVTITHYIVQPGDTLTSIGAAHGTTAQAVHLANPWIADADLIQPGWVLHVVV